MNSPLVKISSFDNANALSTLILTPNQRIARKVIEASRDSTKVAWESPPVYSLNDWIEACWVELQNTAHPSAAKLVLLNDQESVNVWAKVISEDPSYSSILNGLELASMAVSADRTIALWESDPAAYNADSFETERFLRWRSQVHDLYRIKGWVTFEIAVQIVIEAIESEEFMLPEAITIFGFDEVPPLTGRLFQSLEGSGRVTVKDDAIGTMASSISKVGVMERDHQATAAAHWALEHLEQNPDSRIAIVCPELAQRKDLIESAFRRVFEPQSFLLGSARYTAPFNISAGIPLAKVPIVECIFSFLGAPGKRFSLDELRQLMLTPFIAGGVKELVARQRFIARLKKARFQRIKLFDLLSYVDLPACFAESLSKLSHHFATCPHQQNLSQWAFWINKACEAVGWPGDRNLDSEEFQAIQQWNTLLNDFSSLEKIYAGVSGSRAIALLRQCAMGKVFKPESHDSNIQILGALEAAGLSFDKVWVMDMNDDIWPPAPSPNPFIPLDVQKTEGMPHSTSERELDFSKRITDRLCHSGHEIVLSYGLWDDDRELRPSSLIDHVDPLAVSDHLSAAKDSFGKIIKATVTSESVQDNYVPIDQTKVRGGAGVFTSQSRCPFQAFAKYRLRAGEKPDCSPGLTPAERGNVIHNALEFFWKEMKDWKSLVNCPDDVLSLNVSEAVDHGLFLLKNGATTLSNTILGIERKRTVELILGWLEMEKSRSPFSVVSNETLMDLSVGGLKIKVRIDRIDEMEDGSRLAIDYKTGRTVVKDWAGNRPDDLQMPVYAVSDQSDGVAIGTLRKDDVRMKGIIASDAVDGLYSSDSIPDRLNLPSGWSELKNHWNSILDHIGSEFLSGVNTVSPSHAKHCRTCQYQSICRKDF